MAPGTEPTHLRMGLNLPAFDEKTARHAHREFAGDRAA
jgi:hypothetical protein